MPDVKFTFNATGIERALANLGNSDVIAVVYNDASSPNGVYYWNYVNDGRGPVRPINAKVLHWVDPKTGEDVFAMYAGPTAPQHIRENALPAIRNGAIAKIRSTGPQLSREYLVDLVNGIARVAVAELQQNTPGKGPLFKKYRIDRAT